MLWIVTIMASPSGAPAEARGNEILTEGRALYSQFREELIIRHFFRDRRDGFFLDIGCFEWKKINTTYYLEKHLNWSGIAVDAQERYTAGWKANRPRSKFFAYAITDKSGETITFYEAGKSGGLSSTEMTNIEVWQEIRRAKGRELPVREISVPTITLDDLLDREGVERIDFLSLDVNGTEPTALAGFDIRRFAPELVLVEASRNRQEALLEYFVRNGYERIDEYLDYDHVNWYFTPREVRELGRP